MLRAPTPPSQAILRLLTLAIAVVVGFQVGPQLSGPGPSAPVLGSADQKVSEDTFKVGERLELRVFPAPFLDRFSPAHRSGRLGIVAGPHEALAPGASAYDGRSESERLPIVKHVPRMERGDPPRT